MNQDHPSAVSPFSALSYQEQQQKWLEWRSRQLDYRPAADGGQPMEAQEQTAAAPPAQDGFPPMRLPNMRIASPARHRELDEVLSRHRQAMRRAGAFHTTAID